VTSLFQAEPDFEEPECRRSRRSRRLKRKLKGRADGELNIVSMIDVFAVLVFFLLVGSSISASKLHTLNLTIPVASSTPVKTDDDFHLAVSLYKDYVVVTQGEKETRLAHVNGVVDTASLAKVLRLIKSEHPDEERVSLLVEDSIPYDQIIRVMDSLRTAAPSSNIDGAEKLFPAISMGDISLQSHDVNDAGGK
jgi:biopolymer transport protein ExbD